MREGARLAAAIEILTDVEERHRTAADAVKDWMGAHRFAGSKDRSAIGDAVFGALRWRASSAWRFGHDGPRALTLGALRWGFGESLEAVTAMFADPHAPEPLSKSELATLAEETAQSRLDGAPPDVRGDYPEWLDASLIRNFADARAEEGAALAAPAPLDLRANTLKTTREKLLEALAHSTLLRVPPAPTPHAPDGVRIPWRRAGAFAWASEQSFQKGWYEVQDEGSQLAVRLAGAEPGMQVADICAGAGGKTLALAAIMQNTGQIYAFDIDARRLAPLKARLDRAGARNVQIRAPMRDADALEDLRERMDLVLVDAPCSGSGTWRRNPDAKWRLRPQMLARRQMEQHQALQDAAALVKPGGRIVYVTCSVLPEENEDAITYFLEARSDFTPAPLDPSGDPPAQRRGHALQLTPRLTGCDGFFVAALRRN